MRRRRKPAFERVLSAYRAERRKLLAQLSTRVLALVCALGPIGFAVILSMQSGVPADTLLGVWVHTSGYAMPFVVLGFGAFWGFPALAGVLAGDLFSSEDRYGTWKTVLTRSASRAELFAGKVLAVWTFAIGMVALTALSSLLSGLVLTGGQPLVGLSGAEISSGECLFLMFLSWLLIVLPLLAFTSLAMLLSIATRNGIVGVLGPVIIALAMQLLALIGSGSWMHTLLLASAFDDWHGLLAQPRFYDPLVIGSCISLLWLLACLIASWRILSRRDYAGTPISRRGWLPAARAVLAVAALIIILAAAGSLGGVAITRARLEASITTTFNRLTRLQQEELGRAVAGQAALNDRTICRRRSGQSEGPGDDWNCAIAIATPRAGQLETVGYDVSAESDGCYKANAPTSFVGEQMMSNARGHSVVNPLFTIYGCFDTTASAPRCAETAGCLAKTGGTGSAVPGGNDAEARRLREAEQIAGATVMQKIEKAEREAARERTQPGAAETEQQPRTPGEPAAAR
jgi:ABC-2 type transport system permease protein